MKGDIEKMNECMNEIAISVISIYDVGRKPSEKAPERFYHGFVLGLLLPLEKKFKITSNRESGLGRYDVMFKPRNNQYDAIIVEFKVRDEKKEESLEETAMVGQSGLTTAMDGKRKVFTTKRKHHTPK